MGNKYAVKQLNYEVIRADKISEPGIITTQIIQYIVDSELVISASFDLKMLKESNNEEDRSIADVLEAISDLRLAVTSVGKKVLNTELAKFTLADENKKLIDIVMRIEERIDNQNRRKRGFHPMIREFCGESKEMYILSKEMTHFMRRFLDKYSMNEK